MKKLSLFLLVITITASSFANTTNMDITTVKKIATGEIVTSLKIYGNVEVILTDDQLNEIQIVGEKTDVENTLVKISKGAITISSASKRFFTNKVIVFIPSKALAGVYIHGSSTISSAGVLNNEMLDVTINGNGKSNIVTAGKINVNTIGDFPVE